MVAEGGRVVVGPLRAHVRALPPDSWLHVGDLVGEFGTRSAVVAGLGRAAAAGEVVALHPGVWWKGRVTRFGMARPSTVMVGVEVARGAGYTGGVGPAGWTASNMLGLSTQVPRHCHLAVPGPAPVPPAHVQFHERAVGGRVGLGFVEVAVLEVLLAWPHQIEATWAEVAAKVRRLAADGHIDLEKVVAAAPLEPDAAVGVRAQSLAP